MVILILLLALVIKFVFFENKQELTEQLLSAEILERRIENPKKENRRRIQRSFSLISNNSSSSSEQTSSADDDERGRILNELGEKKSSYCFQWNIQCFFFHISVNVAEKKYIFNRLNFSVNSDS